MSVPHVPPTLLSLGEAAKLTGKSKSLLSKYLNNGKLSYVRKTSAGYEIDPSELLRVFPDMGTQEDHGHVQKNDRKPLKNTREHPQSTDIAVLNLQLQTAEEALKREREERERERHNQSEAVKHWRNQAESHMRLLEDHSKKAESEAEQLRREREELRQEAQQREAKQAERVQELEEKLDNTPRTVWEMLFGRKG